MISFAQVMAALAAGAMLTVATMLTFRLYGVQHPAEEAEPDEGGGSAPDDEAEWKIEAARSLALTAVETFRHQVAETAETQQQRAAEWSAAAVQPADSVRSKGHLTLVACGRRTDTPFRHRFAVDERRRPAEYQDLRQR
ncbi:hypothetical protein KVH22_29825 [Streptomyces olivaceus]|uniref:hypothetical protein n=1 Tax=Streptomyces olivaceus TaxID=47716 RepID=UPI001CCDC2D6|nr:hypothetical protein [Streptomyces olivaceus]MBZ6259718.1 hypothetical protein [Streptomyces olivaceus]